MKRGMISLSKQQLVYTASLLEQATNYPPELPVRINAALQTNETQTELELSEESAEVILDSLPMPSQEEQPLITSTRTSFQTFLSSLRANA